jgi:hypothetical protein
MPVTINDVRYAVEAALNAVFPDIPVTDKETDHNLEPPYFLVTLLESTHTQELGRRYARSYPFEVRFFAGDTSRDNLYDTAELLTTALGRIVVSGRCAASACAFNSSTMCCISTSNTVFTCGFPGRTNRRRRPCRRSACRRY